MISFADACVTYVTPEKVNTMSSCMIELYWCKIGLLELKRKLWIKVFMAMERDVETQFKESWDVVNFVYTESHE
jgi:hypothetical protein